MKDCTDSPKETLAEQNARVDVMLRTMVVEAGLHSMEHDLDPPSFTRNEIGDFCGASKDHIRRIELGALRKLKKLLS